MQKTMLKRVLASVDGLVMKISSGEIRRTIHDGRGIQGQPLSIRHTCQVDSPIFAQARSRALGAPDMRTDQIVTIQEKLESEEYIIGSGDIAEKLLGRVLCDQVE